MWPKVRRRVSQIWGPDTSWLLLFLIVMLVLQVCFRYQPSLTGRLLLVPALWLVSPERLPVVIDLAPGSSRS